MNTKVLPLGKRAKIKLHSARSVELDAVVETEAPRLTFRLESGKIVSASDCAGYVILG